MTCASLLFHSFLAHLVFIMTIVSACAYNGANFYAKLLQPLYYMSVYMKVGGESLVPEAHQGPSRAFYSASMGVQRVVSSVVKAQQQQQQGKQGKGKKTC